MEKPKRKPRTVKPKETEKKAPAAKKTTRKAAPRKTSPKKENKEKLATETPKAKKKAAPKKTTPKKASPKTKKAVAKTTSNSAPATKAKVKKETAPKRQTKTTAPKKSKAQPVAKVEKTPKAKTPRVNRTTAKRNPKKVAPSPELNAPLKAKDTSAMSQNVAPRNESKQEPKRQERNPNAAKRPVNTPPERKEAVSNNNSNNKREDRRSDQGQQKRNVVKREEKRIVNKRNKRENPPRQNHSNSSSRDDKRNHSKRDDKSNSSKTNNSDTTPTPKVRIHQSVAILVDGNNIEMSIHSMLHKKKAMINFDTLIPKLLKERGLNRLIYFREGKSISSKLAERLHNLYYGTVVPCHKSADIPLTIAATQIAEKVDTIIILSGDADYVELVKHLTSRGVRVEIAAVEQTTASILRNAADFFFPITKEDCFVLG